LILVGELGHILDPESRNLSEGKNQRILKNALILTLDPGKNQRMDPQNQATLIS